MWLLLTDTKPDPGLYEISLVPIKHPRNQSCIRLTCHPLLRTTRLVLTVKSPVYGCDS